MKENTEEKGGKCRNKICNRHKMRMVLTYKCNTTEAKGGREIEKNKKKEISTRDFNRFRVQNNSVQAQARPTQVFPKHTQRVYRQTQYNNIYMYMYIYHNCNPCDDNNREDNSVVSS